MRDRFQWMGKSGEVTREYINAHLADGLGEDRPEVLTRLWWIHDKLPPPTSRGLALRMRDVNAAVFTAPCFDLARRIDALAMVPLSRSLAPEHHRKPSTHALSGRPWTSSWSTLTWCCSPARGPRSSTRTPSILPHTVATEP